MGRNGDITIKLLESDREIKNKIYKGLMEDINAAINKNKNSVIRRLNASIEGWIRRQPEVVSLLSDGKLKSLNAQFGLPRGSVEGAVDEIISSALSTLEIDIKPINEKLKGGVEFKFQNQDYINLLGLGAGHVITESGTDLHWLDWLIIKGDTVIVKGYEYSTGNRGRSRGGFMDLNLGGVWRVPPQFSGIRQDNFLTRAFEGKDKQIEVILRGLLK